MTYEEMTIPQLEGEIGRLQGVVSAAYAEQKTVHDVMERKIKLIPITTGPNDQHIMAPSVKTMLQAKLPAALFDQIKGFLGEDK